MTSRNSRKAGRAGIFPASLGLLALLLGCAKGTSDASTQMPASTASVAVPVGGGGFSHSDPDEPEPVGQGGTLPDDPPVEPPMDPSALDAGRLDGGQASLKPFTFDDSTQGFAALDSQPPSLAEMTSILLVENVGIPLPGSLLFQSPFDDQGQWVRLGGELPAPIDLTGAQLLGSVRLGDGLGVTVDQPGEARLFVATATGATAFGQWSVLERGSWVTLSLSSEAPAASDVDFDPAEVVQMGLEVGTGSKIQNYQSATVLVDNIRWQSN